MLETCRRSSAAAHTVVIAQCLEFRSPLCFTAIAKASVVRCGFARVTALAQRAQVLVCVVGGITVDVIDLCCWYYEAAFFALLAQRITSELVWADACSPCVLVVWPVGARALIGCSAVRVASCVQRQSCASWVKTWTNCGVRHGVKKTTAGFLYGLGAVP